MSIPQKGGILIYEIGSVSKGFIVNFSLVLIASITILLNLVKYFYQHVRKMTSLMSQQNVDRTEDAILD